jgi:hypothetical protein
MSGVQLYQPVVFRQHSAHEVDSDDDGCVITEFPEPNGMHPELLEDSALVAAPLK